MAEDNIADTATVVTPADNVANDDSGGDNNAENTVDMDAYLERFDKVSATNERLATILSTLDKAPYDQDLIQVVIKYMHALQKQNEAMYDLLVDMNNVFGV